MKKAVVFDLYGTLIDIRTDEDDPWVYQTLSRFLSYHCYQGWAGGAKGLIRFGREGIP